MSTPSPFTVTHAGLSYRVELDVHYISDENMQTLRKYITTLIDENEKLRETLSILWFCQQYATDCDDCKINNGDGKILEPCAECACDSLCNRIRELGVKP